MIAINRPHGGGKTHTLITEYFLKSNALLLVSDIRKKKAIIRTYRLSPQDQQRIITWKNAPEKVRGLGKDILIDDADKFLSVLFWRIPVAVSFTGESK